MNYLRLSLLTIFTITTGISNSFAETIKLSIPDMECDNCSHAIEDRLKQEKDITKISIDIKDRIATVYTVDSVKISDEKLKSLVKDSGFEVKSIERVN